MISDEYYADNSSLVVVSLPALAFYSQSELDILAIFLRESNIHIEGATFTTRIDAAGHSLEHGPANLAHTRWTYQWRMWLIKVFIYTFSTLNL
jgi:hypothetical protein